MRTTGIRAGVFALVLLGLGFLSGCESTEGGGAQVSGGVYYGVGFYDPWYYGPGYYPPAVIAPPPSPPPSAAPPHVEQPIAKPPSVSRPPSIPTGPRPAFRR